MALLRSPLLSNWVRGSRPDGKFRNCKIAAILTILILLSPPTLLNVLKIINGLFQFGLNARVPKKFDYRIMLANLFFTNL